MPKYCSNCGNKLDEGEIFCPECGSKVVKGNNAPKNTIVVDESNTPRKTIAVEESNTPRNTIVVGKNDENKSNESTNKVSNNIDNNSNTLLDIINLKLVVVIVALAIIGVIAIGVFSHNDVIEIQGVNLDYGSSDLTSMAPQRPKATEKYTNQTTSSSHSGGQKGTFSLNAVPKQNIPHIKDVMLENVIITLENGTQLRYDSFGLNVYMSGTKMPSDNLILLKDMSYIFKFNVKLPYNTESRSPVTHITGDLIVDTTTDQNMNCGHIDSDIVV